MPHLQGEHIYRRVSSLWLSATSDQVLLRSSRATRHPARPVSSDSAASSKYVGVGVRSRSWPSCCVSTPGPERRLLSRRRHRRRYRHLPPRHAAGDQAHRALVARHAFEYRHAIEGHDVALPPQLTWGVFHLQREPVARRRRAAACSRADRPCGAVRRAPGATHAGGADREPSPCCGTPSTKRRRLSLIPISSATCCRWYRCSPCSPRPSSTRCYHAGTAAASSPPWPWFWRRCRRCRHRCGSTPTTSIRAQSYRRSSPPAARGVIVDRYADYERARRLLGLSFRPTADMADIVVTANSGL